MSDSARAVRAFERAYNEGAGSVDFQRVNDRGLKPTDRDDPSKAVSFRERKGKGVRIRCAKCASLNAVAHEDLEEAGYRWFAKDGTHEQWPNSYEERGSAPLPDDDGDDDQGDDTDDDSVDPDDVEEGKR